VNKFANFVRELCDVHINKMPLESVQCLSTAHRFFGHDVGYKASHINHPINVWLRESRENYHEMWHYAYALFMERRRRWPAKPPHKSASVLLSLYRGPKEIPDVAGTEQPLCMPDQFKIGDVRESYKAYYVHKIQDFHNRGLNTAYTRTLPPSWLPMYLHHTKN
jgi:hypothetical protein